MIDIKSMFALLQSVEGFADKVAYYEWPIGEAPSLPFICFFSPGDTAFGADNINYYYVPRYRVELYTKDRDLATESRLESAFEAAGLYYTKESEYLDSERCQVTVFAM